LHPERRAIGEDALIELASMLAADVYQRLGAKRTDGPIQLVMCDFKK
jgi:hypothetical protein